MGKKCGYSRSTKPLKADEVDFEKLKRAIVKSGFKQGEITRRIGRSYSFLSICLRNKKIGKLDLIKVCEVLKKKPEDFLITKTQNEPIQQALPYQSSYSAKIEQLPTLTDERYKIQVLDLLDYIANALDLMLFEWTGEEAK